MSLSFRDVTIGLSRMVAIDELRSGIHRADPRGTWALGYIGASGTARHGMLNFPKNDGGGPNNSVADSDDIVGCTAIETALGVDAVAKLGMPCLAASNETNNQATSRSMHADGVHVLMLEGSAHFVSDTVNLDVWYNMHRRNSPEAFELPF